MGYGGTRLEEIDRAKIENNKIFLNFKGILHIFYKKLKKKKKNE